MKQPAPADIVIVFREIPITYVVKDNIWKFILRGFEKHATSLDDAVKRINLSFSRQTKSIAEIPILIDHTFDDGEDAFVPGKIVAKLPNKYGSSRFKVRLDTDGTEITTTMYAMYADTPGNRKLTKELKTVLDQIKVLEKRVSVINKGLRHFKIKLPKEEL